MAKNANELGNLRIMTYYLKTDHSQIVPSLYNASNVNLTQSFSAGSIIF